MLEAILFENGENGKKVFANTVQHWFFQLSSTEDDVSDELKYPLEPPHPLPYVL